jgi:glycerol-3-phosphate O-acyltransferase 3/4
MDDTSLNRFISSSDIYEGWAFGEFAVTTVDSGEQKQLQEKFEREFAKAKANAAAARQQRRERRRQRYIRQLEKEQKRDSLDERSKQLEAKLARFDDESSWSGTDETGDSDGGNSSESSSSSSTMTATSSTSSSSSSSSSSSLLAFDWQESFPFFREASEVLVRDSFTRCFRSRPVPRWNFTWYLWPAWLAGLLFRYVLLFPCRVLYLLLGTAVFLTLHGAVTLVARSEAARVAARRWLLRFWAGVFVSSWSGVIRYHGTRPVAAANQVFVANHTSMIDVIVLTQRDTYAIVGQKHAGWVGWVQDNVLSGLWFNRRAAADRTRVASAIKAHIADAANDPLIIFPEGTCVNNNYCVMFKKGAFDLGATVAPVAMRYNREWSDAFWNSRATPFWLHLVHLMTQWAVVCDVYFLDPMQRRPNELATQLAARVKSKIAKKARLTNVPWDGYLKHLKLNRSFLRFRQRIFAERLLAHYAETLATSRPLPSKSSRTRRRSTSTSKAKQKLLVQAVAGSAASAAVVTASSQVERKDDDDDDDDDEDEEEEEEETDEQRNEEEQASIMRTVKSSDDLRSLEHAPLPTRSSLHTSMAMRNVDDDDDDVDDNVDVEDDGDMPYRTVSRVAREPDDDQSRPALLDDGEPQEQ